MSGAVVRGKLNDTIDKANSDNSFSFVLVDPSPSDGNVNDVVMNLTTLEVFSKIGPTTWQSQTALQNNITGSPNSFLFVGDTGATVQGDSSLTQLDDGRVRFEFQFNPTDNLGYGYESSFSIPTDGTDNPFQANRTFLNVFGADDWNASFLSNE